MKKIFLLLFSLYLCAMPLTGCELSDFGSDSGDSGDAVAVEGNTDKLYKSIEDMIKDYRFEGAFSGVDENDVIATYLAVVEEHPEYFWVSNGYNLEIMTVGDKKTVNLKIVSDADVAKLPERKAALDAELDKIVEKANAYSTDFDKALFVHDYLIDNTVYDLDAAESVMTDVSGNKIPDASTSYGCLINKKAICSGYSAAYQLILTELGITCGKVNGQRNEGEDHQWNYIMLEGDYYYVDVTWDDPVSENNADNKSHEFFCITTKELETTHEIERVGFIPDCNATKYNYFVAKGLYFEDYSFDALTKVISDNAQKDSLELKFASEGLQEKASRELIDKGKIFDIDNVSKNISYSISDSKKIITFFF